MFLAQLGADFVQGDRFVCIVCFNELCSNPRSDSEKKLGLGGTCCGVLFIYLDREGESEYL